jgi:RHH-type proline utilization regulon transcriptional repressor/proline dehydrogenase/delta 1-pyrroline-5-carboxylate dehydrogenase
MPGRPKRSSARPEGVFTCISPWNFPLAIFTGQIAGRAAAGQRRARETGRTDAAHRRARHGAAARGGRARARRCTSARHGVDGRRRAHLRQAGVDGVAFTGSTATAQAIHRAMAANLAPDATLIAETGGLNAMIVDSTALPEQAVRDIIASAFQSAGQRCSALRCLYVQEDVAGQLPGDAFRRDGRTLHSAIPGQRDRYRPGDRRRGQGAITAYISRRPPPRVASCRPSPRRRRAISLAPA